jgi:hypothetical protein
MHLVPKKTSDSGKTPRLPGSHRLARKNPSFYRQFEFKKSLSNLFAHFRSNKTNGKKKKE